MNVKNLFGAISQQITANSALLCCLLLLGVVCALAFRPQPVQPLQRFVPIPDPNGNTNVALDTMNGRSCLTLPKKMAEEAAKERDFPFCNDLYKETK